MPSSIKFTRAGTSEWWLRVEGDRERDVKGQDMLQEVTEFRNKGWTVKLNGIPDARTTDVHSLKEIEVISP